ncbi:MAG: hypothetical protein ACTH2Q_13275 [Propionibacteriaceae bacterium]
MDDSELSDLLEEMRTETEKLRAGAKESTELRLKWERQRATDRDLIRKLDSALAGEITWLDVMSSPEYQKAHAAEFDEAIKDYERREKEGTLPSPEEADARISEFMATMQSDVAAAEQAEVAAARAEQAADEEQQRAADSPFVPPTDRAIATEIEPMLIGDTDDMPDSPPPSNEHRDESPFLPSKDEDVAPALGSLTGFADDQ